MGRVSWFLAGILLASCGGAVASFPYKYYVIKAEKFEGRLEGDRPENDLPFTECKPRPGREGPCIAMLKDAYFQLKSEYLSLQSDLAACQRGQ